MKRIKEFEGTNITNSDLDKFAKERNAKIKPLI